MLKHIKLTFAIFTLLSLSFSYSQTVAAVGFVPNKGQYNNINLGAKIIGKLCGLDHDIWLTNREIVIVYNNYSQYEYEGDFGDSLAMKQQRVEIFNINPISLDSVKLYDTSTNIFNYYLPSCPNGLLDIRSYRKIIVESVLDGVDLEITYSSNNNIITKFISSNSTLDIRLNTYEDDANLLGSDLVKIDEEFSIFKYIPYPSYRNLVNDTNFATSYSSTAWFTLFNGGYSNLVSMYEGLGGNDNRSEDFIQISNSISDILGNYYTLGNYVVPFYSARGDRYDYSTDIFINKFDNDGNLLWTTYYGSSNNDMPKTIVLNSKNHIYISGSVETFDRDYKNDFPLSPPSDTNSYFSDSGSLFILKLDSNGKQIWSTLVGNGSGEFYYRGDKRSYETSDCDFFSSAKSSKDDIYFSGTTQSIVSITTITGNPVDRNNRIIDSETYASIAGIPIVGDSMSSIWQIPLIDSLNGGRWIKVLGVGSMSDLDTLILRTYPFILKLDSNDNLVWSTYFFTNQPINAMVVDKKDNLYIGGHTTESYLPLKQKGYGFFKDKDLIRNKNRRLNYRFGSVTQRERRAYIAEFNKDNTLIWCTYLEDSVDMDGTTTIISDMAIDVSDNLLVTGYTNNRDFPLLSKEGAYYNDHSLSRALKKDAFIMQFNSLGILRWSTLCVLDSNSWGVSLQSLPGGRLFLAMHGIPTTTSYLQSAYLYEFNKNYSLRNIDTLPFRVARVAPNFININSEFASTLNSRIFESNIDIDFYDAVERFTDFVSPVLNLSYNRRSLFLSGNLIDYNYSESKFIKPTSTSFMQTEYSWYSYSEEKNLLPNNIHHSGFILKQGVCDSVNFVSSLYCIDNEDSIHIPLKVDSLMFSKFYIFWYKNDIEVGTGINYTITDIGSYYMIAYNIIDSECHYYSNVINVVYNTIDLNFRKDTVSLCVGDSIYVIDAYRFGASYLWSDGSTNSTYTVRYKGDSVYTIWCHITNYCGGEDLDSVIVRFYPPFAYLGEDTILCRGQVLNFDASILNRNVSADLEYKWFLNGDTVLGTGTNNELFTITEKDSGQLVLQVIWEEMELKYECERGIDTLNFSYYQYDNVYFYLPEDTTICVYEKLEIDLIQTLEPNTDNNNIYLCLSSTGDTISKESNFILEEPLTYYISASNYCSKYEDTLKLNFFTDFNIEKLLFPTDTILCKGQVLNFDASILNNNIPDTVTLVYEWFLNGESVSGAGTNNELFTITENYSGQLVLHAIWPESGCKLVTDTLNFSYYQYDNVYFYLPEDTTICVYEKLEIDLIQTLEPNTDNNNIYLCLSSTGDTISKESNFILEEPLTYYISASNYCSKYEDTLKLNFFTDFNIEKLLPTDTILCKGQVLNFDASILNNNIPDTVTLVYEWFLNGESVSGAGTNNELFTITENYSGPLVLHAIWPESGCKLVADTLNFSYYKYNNVDFYLPSDTSICFYEDLEINLIANMTNNIDINTVYLCIITGTRDVISTRSRFVLKEPLSYTISVTNHCSKQEQILKLNHFTDFNIKMLFPTDQTICKDLLPAQIYGLTEDQKDGTCYWLSEDKEETIEIAPSMYINRDGLYPITLSDIYNCSQDYEITVSIKEDCAPIIDMPNVFTPNSDGVNDEFKIISADNINDFDIVIFNKAGTKVYEYEGLIENFAWNGCYKNSARDVPEGAYFFVILYKDFFNVARKRAGTITLLR